ncbi:UDP-N-acetyl-D-mannosamine dehydrogenase [Pseudodesulfovibrio methanolicus]|uniref:UDP-N-acetyl-D-mannosamine dehydrogenase n=1 Tax=Pseudodesulfovibrio methanolicus TaxID=3126690 RepID=A0ABZ2ITL8_9BACT
MKSPYKNICVIGLGYIGLPTSACLASRGVNVHGVDVNKNIVNRINAGDVHIVEEGLDELVKTVVKQGKLEAGTSPVEADAFIITVPTPINEDKTPCMDYVWAAVRSIASVLKKGDLVILESTSPVHTTTRMLSLLQELCPELTFAKDWEDSTQDVYVAYCPERVIPGRTMYELVNNDRVVGGASQACAARAKSLYGIFVEGECIVTNAKTAEMAKLTENAYRDVNIAFANELSMICKDSGIDPWELISLANRHPRVNILQPSPGVGGHCIALDPWFIVDQAPARALLIRTARQVNIEKENFVFEEILGVLAGRINCTIAVWGLAYKPNIDDLRESPALSIARRLVAQKGLRVLVVEPNAESDFVMEGGEMVSLELSLEQADVIAILVGHDQFKQVSSDRLEAVTVMDFVNALQ